MKNNIKNCLVPQYMSSFKCIGPECEDNCCIGWSVLIDQKSYKNYAKCPNKKLMKKLDENISRNRQNPNKFSYAVVKMKENGNCPFLDEKKLCELQIELGADYLCNTCFNYPRIMNYVNGMMEKSATLSCPEAARLALLNESPMEFNETESELNSRSVFGQNINTGDEDVDVDNLTLKYFWELRIFTIDLLQNRNYRLWERLIILDMFYSKVQEYIEMNNENSFLELISYYRKIISSNAIEDLFRDIPRQDNIQILILKTLIDKRVIAGINSSRYLECLNDFLSGISFTQDAPFKGIINNYRTAYDNYYEPFIVKHEYILENYLVNYVYKNLFPYSQGKRIFGSYVMLIIHYALIKMHLVGIAGFYKENFSIDHVIKLIQSFVKTVEHNSNYLREIETALCENDYMTTAYMAILIK